MAASQTPLGQRFGDLTVMAHGGYVTSWVSARGGHWRKNAQWLVECACGNLSLKLASNVRTGKTTSCGKHGLGSYRLDAKERRLPLCRVGKCRLRSVDGHMCAVHAERRDSGLPLMASPRYGEIPDPLKPCSVAGCPRDLQLHGYCITHADQAARGTSFTVLGPVRKCSVAGCPRDHLMNGMCQMHRKRVYRAEKKAEQK